MAKDGPRGVATEAAARVQLRPGHIFFIEKYRPALHAALRLPLVRHGRHEGHSEGEPTRGRPRRIGRSEPLLPCSHLALDSPTLPVRTNVAASSGSTSMASVCAASLALHDCGVPLRAPVAGSSIGLSGSTLLTDPTGTEDHFGSMDCKVAGTERGATAAQVDVKGDGVSLEVLGEAFSRASTARREILGHMDSCVLNGDREPRRPRSSDAPFLLVDDDDVVEARLLRKNPRPPSFLAAALRRRAGAEPAGAGTGAAATYEATAADGGEAPAAIKTPRAARAPS